MIPLECICANTRRAARLVTQLYSHELGAEIEPSQFLLLSVLAHRPGVSQRVLGEALGYDKTTLSRSLRLMQRNGWVTVAVSNDGRQRGYKLTEAGTRLLRVTKPRWQRAQDKMSGAMTANEWDTVGNAFETLSRVASRFGLSGI